MKSHLAVYGNVQMVRVYCETCQRYALVIQEIKQCCDERIDVIPGQIKRMSEPESRRRLPGVADRRAILESQGFRCLYCDVAFDGYVYFRGKFKKVKLNWDHMAPYTYSMDNKHQNFAAACQFCNSWKGGLIFKTVDEVRIYVAAKWEKERGDVRKLRERGLLDAVPSKTQMAEVLQPEVPVPRLGPAEPSPLEVAPRCQHCGRELKTSDVPTVAQTVNGERGTRRTQGYRQFGQESHEFPANLLRGQSRLQANEAHTHEASVDKVLSDTLWDK